VVSALALVATAISPTSGRLAERVRGETVVAIALGLGALGLALATVLDSIPAAYIVSFLVGVGNGLISPHCWCWSAEPGRGTKGVWPWV
jgi:MFS family permease